MEKPAVTTTLEVTLDTDINISPENRDFYERVFKHGVEVELLNTSFRIPADPYRDMDAFVLYALETLEALSLAYETGAVVTDIQAARFVQIQKLRHAMPEDLFLDYERKLAALND